MTTRARPTPPSTQPKTSSEPMSSPAKKRKKNPPSAPYRGKTLDHFFGKKSASKVVPSAPDGGDVDDEQYARGLAKLWDEEDRNGGATTATVGSSSSGTVAGSKRRRSSSRERGDFQLAERGQSLSSPSPGTSKQTKHNPSPPPLPPPKKDGLSIQAAEEIYKILDSIPLGSDPLSFDPDDYQSLADSWPDGRATYGLLTRAFVLVNATRSRIKIADTLVNLLRILIRFDPSSLLPAVCGYSLSAFPAD